MSNAFDFPSNAAIADQKGNLPMSWLQWFSRTHAIVTASQQSGTTANRPTDGLWIGRIYYDTTLGFPVWVNSVGPVVWHDAAGNVV